MHRLQISLTQAQYEFLKSEAFVSGQSMAAVLRDLLDEIILRRQAEILDSDPIWQAVGIGHDIPGPTDVSRNVDKYLYGEPLENTTPNSRLAIVAEESNEYTPD